MMCMTMAFNLINFDFCSTPLNRDRVINEIYYNNLNDKTIEENLCQRLGQVSDCAAQQKHKHFGATLQRRNRKRFLVQMRTSHLRTR